VVKILKDNLAAKNTRWFDAPLAPKKSGKGVEQEWKKLRKRVDEEWKKSGIGFACNFSVFN